MTTEREPLLSPVAVKELRPTQITVGMREVAVKRRMIRSQSARKTGTFLGNHMIPVVLGPKDATTSPTTIILPARCLRKVSRTCLSQ